MKNMNLVTGLLLCALLATEATIYGDNCAFSGDDCKNGISFASTESSPILCGKKGTISLTYTPKTREDSFTANYKITGPQNFEADFSDEHPFSSNITINKLFTVPYAGNYLLTTTINGKFTKFVCTFSCTVRVKNTCLPLLMCCKKS